MSAQETKLLLSNEAKHHLTPRRSLPFRTLLQWLGLILGPLILFALFLLAVGADPIRTFRMMFNSAFGDRYGIGEVLIAAAPFALAGLATAIPARVRLVNVGAEGQLAIGALTATFAAVALMDTFPKLITLPLLVLAGAVGGALWSTLAGFLRVRFQLNETISTLLLNYVAFLVVGYFVHGILRDPDSFNWPFSPPFVDAARFTTIGGTRLHWGVILAPLIALLTWYVIARTFIGLRLRVVGGNPEAARRAGYDVDRIQLWVFVVAGALAGIAGMVEVVGVEGRLRPTTGVGIGYVGFLAAWMVNHHPLWLIGSSLLLAVIAVSGDSLQIAASLPASSVNILMALVLIGVLMRSNQKSKR
ncbi:MAG: ABC transporter permease [Chloroflexota bacterium]